MDRNKNAKQDIALDNGSLSARRAWIEMLTDDVSTGGKIVALRKESVDRNQVLGWRLTGYLVALRKESVDRNCHYRDDVSN